MRRLLLGKFFAENRGYAYLHIRAVPREKKRMKLLKDVFSICLLDDDKVRFIIDPQLSLE